MSETSKFNDFFFSEEEYKKRLEIPDNAYVGTSTVQYKTEELRKEAIVYRQARQRWEMYKLKYDLDEQSDLKEEYVTTHKSACECNSCHCESCVTLRKRKYEDKIKLDEWRRNLNSEIDQTSLDQL